VAEGLDLLSDVGPACPAELRHLLRELLGGAGGSCRLLARQRLAPDVYRLRFDVGGRARSLVAKRSEPHAARRNHLASARWLPAVGLGDHGPPLLGTAAEPGGQRVWQVYDDLGDRVLDERAPEPACLAAAVRVIAQLHTRFAEHPWLAECRLLGGDYGVGFYTASVRDAIRCLGSLERSPGGLPPGRAALCARLLGRLHQLRAEGPARVQALQELGGPETLLHGDLWPKNVLVCPCAGGPHVRLIDWDRAGVGPVSYDLSTFLSRCPVRERPGILELYREATRHLGWRWPSAAAWNVLFETAERARLANCIVWRALATREGHAEWAFQELASLERWLDELQPILPVGRPDAG
jgi:hypothetical protein